MIVWIHREQRGDNGTWWVRWGSAADIRYHHSRAVVDKLQQLFHPLSNSTRFRLYYGGNSLAITDGHALEQTHLHSCMQLMVSPETFTELYYSVLRYLHMMEG